MTETEFLLYNSHHTDKDPYHCLTKVRNESQLH